MKNADIAFFVRWRYIAPMKKTGFRDWRDKMGFTQDDAAAALGVSKSQVANWDAGKDRANGKRAAPGLAARKLMALLIRGEDIKAWPE